MYTFAPTTSRQGGFPLSSGLVGSPFSCGADNDLPASISRTPAVLPNSFPKGMENNIDIAKILSESAGAMKAAAEKIAWFEEQCMLLIDHDACGIVINDSIDEKGEKSGLYRTLFCVEYFRNRDDRMAHNFMAVIRYIIQCRRMEDQMEAIDENAPISFVVVYNADTDNPVWVGRETPDQLIVKEAKES